MYKLYVFAVLATTALAVIALPEARIVGGHEVDIVKHPYLVSIRYRMPINPDNAYWHRCGGSIYNAHIVITSAQCTDDLSADDRVMVVAGAITRTGADGMQYPVKQWISHPNYMEWLQTADYDIALMILEEPFDFTQLAIKPIKIRERRPLDGKMATIAGWGYREPYGPSSRRLEEAVVPIVNAADCGRVYTSQVVTERMICAGYLYAGGTDACQGDTGGPLVVEGELVGLVSWGRGCALPNYPSVYTYVASLKKWIDDTVAENVSGN